MLQQITKRAIAELLGRNQPPPQPVVAPKPKQLAREGPVLAQGRFWYGGGHPAIRRTYNCGVKVRPNAVWITNQPIPMRSITAVRQSAEGGGLMRVRDHFVEIDFESSEGFTSTVILKALGVRRNADMGNVYAAINSARAGGRT
jgi:hypothetical protein